MVPNMFSNLLFIKTNLQEVCTVQSQPAQGTIGRCGVYDGFYSRRCCADCCPAQTQCYKREAWIRPGYLGETFDTAVIEVTDTCKLQFGFGEGCMYSPNRIHIDCEGDDGGGTNCDTECFEPNSSCPCFGISTGRNNKVQDAAPKFAKASYSAKPSPQCYCSSSPILIDVLGNGYAMTDAAR